MERQQKQYSAGQAGKLVLNINFTRGDCPEGFYQAGNECLYFFTGDDYLSWKQAQCTCAQRVNRILNRLSSSYNQLNIQPAKGVRQLVLNTPEKVKILRAFLQEHNQGNFATDVPYDYYTATRFLDRTDNDWPEYCKDGKHFNSTCFETASNDKKDICLREVSCNETNLRLACEFTLPGAAELTSSQFRKCVVSNAGESKLWSILILLVIGLLLALIIVGIIIRLVLILKKKYPRPDKTAKSNESSEPNVAEPMPIINADPAAEPLVP